MKARALNNRRGTTLIETLVSMALLSLVVIGTLALLTNMLTIWAKGSSGTSANQYASLALARMVREVEEGKSASVVNGKLVVVYPYLNTTTGDYDRTIAGQTVTYYLSGNTGSETTGANLWRSVTNGAKTRLARHIDQASFFTMAGGNRAVQIQLRGIDQEGGCITPKTVRVTIKLRNS